MLRISILQCVRIARDLPKKWIVLVPVVVFVQEEKLAKFPAQLQHSWIIESAHIILDRIVKQRRLYFNFRRRERRDWRKDEEASSKSSQ